MAKTAKQQTAKAPTGAKKAASKKPAAKKPVAKKAAAKKPVARKPVAKKPVAKKPVASKAAAKRSPAKVAKKSAPAEKPATKASARARGVTVDAYVAGLPSEHQAIARRVIALVASVAPSATTSIKWGQPVFEHVGPMIWMKSFSKHFGVGFWRGAELPDPKGLLEGDGDRMRHVKLRAVNELDDAGLGALVKAAVDANAQKGDPSKRK